MIASSDKPVDRIAPPVPLELMRVRPRRRRCARSARVELRDVPHSPDGGVIADYVGPVDDPAALAARLAATPGVVEHGLFPPDARLRDPGRARREGAAPRPAELARARETRYFLAVFGFALTITLWPAGTSTVFFVTKFRTATRPRFTVTSVWSA